MKYKEIKFTKRINTGDWTFKEITLVADIEAKETPSQAIKDIEKVVDDSIQHQDITVGTTLDSVTEDETETKGNKNGKRNSNNSDNKNNRRKNTDKQDEDISGKSDEYNEATDDEDVDNDYNSSDDEELEGSDAEGEDSNESEDEESGEADSAANKRGKVSKQKDNPKKSNKESSPKSGKKVGKSKDQVYDRNSEVHKQIFAGIIRSLKPDWKKSTVLKQRAKVASEKLEGTLFLDENGDVLPSFETELKKLFLRK